MNGVPIHYTLDLAAGLTQVLSDGDNAYLYGVGRIGEQQPDGWQYHLGDALGSVRQLAESAGIVGLASGYEPYGTPLSTSGPASSTYAFTGAEVDLTALTYLRSRYYGSAAGRFLTRDQANGDQTRPASYNPWLYTFNNPVNLTDLSGEDPWWCEDRPEPARTLCYQAYLAIDPRDVTDWAYREMTQDANSKTIRGIRDVNRVARALLGAGDCPTDALLELILTGNSQVLGEISKLEGGALHAAALLAFKQLVENGAQWDFKDEMGIRLGPGVTLCLSGQCRSNIEYSQPGNIIYGYIGMAAGFWGWEIQAGAAYAERRDPAHDEDSEEYVEPYQGEWWIDPNAPTWKWNFGDDPRDHEAVTAGIELWMNFGIGMSKAQFGQFLAPRVSRFATCSPDSDAVREKFAVEWPYDVGYFNHLGTSFQTGPGRCP